MAGSSVTSVAWELGQNAKVVKASYVADDADGSVPTFDFTEYASSLYGWGLYCVYHNPGSTGPTTNSDLTLTGLTTGLDYLGGAGTDLFHATATTSAFAGVTGQSGVMPIIEDLRQTITQAAVATNSAAGDVYYVFVRV